jgi:hypothetical protein
MKEYKYDLEAAIANKEDNVIAKALLERLGDDLACDVVVNIASLVDNDDKKWLSDTINRFIPKTK